MSPKEVSGMRTCLKRSVEHKESKAYFFFISLAAAPDDIYSTQCSFLVCKLSILIDIIDTTLKTAQDDRLFLGHGFYLQL